MQKYTLEIQLQPQIHVGQMAYYWKISLETEDGTFTIRDGWADTFETATYNARLSAKYDLQVA